MKSNLFLILTALLLFSCAKKEDNTTVITQKPFVKTVSMDTNLAGTYWYDSQGRLICSRILEPPGIDSTFYIYGNSIIEKKYYNDGILTDIEHGILENGNVVSINGSKVDSSMFWNIYYVYDENGFLIREIHMDNDTVETWRVEYQVLNGNVISMNRSNYLPLVCTYEYYPGTTNSLGSMENMDRFFFFKSKNLVKKIVIAYSFGSPVEENYSYEFYDNGWVKKMSSTVGTQTTNKYFTYW